VLSLLLPVLLAAAPLENDPAFRTARARYDDFEFEDARARFEALLKRQKLDDKTRARVLVWIGMCDAENGALAAASEAFEDAARRDPDVRALPTMSPKARRMLDEARARVVAEANATRATPKKPTPPREAANRDDDGGADAGPVVDERDAPDTAGASRGAEGAGVPGAGSTSAGGGAFVVAGATGLVVGALAGGASAALGALASSAATEAQGLDDAVAARERYASAEQFSLLSTTSLVVAGAVAGAGAIALAVGLLQRDDDEPAPR
jgi:hypothetical protein